MKKSGRKKVNKVHYPIFPWWWLLVPLIIIIVLSVLILRQAPCANTISCISDLSGTYDKTQSTGEFHGQQVSFKHTPEDVTASHVLGETAGNNKRIEVDLTNQRLYAFEENTLKYEFPISSGKWGRTPTGDFRIWVKLRYTRMSGGSKELGTYYNLPNVPYTMFFYNKDIPKSRGYGIHGAYWHNNFGNPMSHGCINMRTEDVEKIYHWANPVSTGNLTYASDDDLGTPIKIYGVARPY